VRTSAHGCAVTSAVRGGVSQHPEIQAVLKTQPVRPNWTEPNWQPSGSIPVTPAIQTRMSYHIRDLNELLHDMPSNQQNGSASSSARSRRTVPQPWVDGTPFHVVAHRKSFPQRRYVFMPARFNCGQENSRGINFARFCTRFGDALSCSHPKATRGSVDLTAVKKLANRIANN
jgi:hypothetical protein